MKIRVKFLIVIISFIVTGSLSAQQFSRYTSVVNTPTAFTIGHGTYQFGYRGYHEGGAEFKTTVGLTDILNIGVSFDLEHAIGQRKIKPHVPGVIAKLKFTDGSDSFPISIAAGYDSFYMGLTNTFKKSTTTSSEPETWDETSSDDSDDDDQKTYSSYNQMIYGPYLVVTKPIYIMDEEQHFSFGVRSPVQPSYVPNDTSYFVSLDIPLGGYFAFKAEVERIYWNFSRLEQVMFNVGFRYNIFAKVGLELDIIVEKEYGVNRVVRVEYTEEF
ncbi:MAG: hypothetical protein PF637_08025 [Spirochaetes bacterium]|jgi:hypothetical protein|nr:hypothetical protein [Spirochaetota bacterium]